MIAVLTYIFFGTNRGKLSFIEGCLETEIEKGYLGLNAYNRWISEESFISIIEAHGGSLMHHDYVSNKMRPVDLRNDWIKSMKGVMCAGKVCSTEEDKH
jgi:hypothetical protein